ncbi:hypothetical protein B5F34_01765 [Mediterranea sp. An20]|nr:hypothetical protein B5F34_01765 [Mediterranea sp. An20]
MEQHADYQPDIFPRPTPKERKFRQPIVPIIRSKSRKRRNGSKEWQEKRKKLLTFAQKSID